MRSQRKVQMMRPLGTQSGLISQMDTIANNVKRWISYFSLMWQLLILNCCKQKHIAVLVDFWFWYLFSYGADTLDALTDVKTMEPIHFLCKCNSASSHINGHIWICIIMTQRQLYLNEMYSAEIWPVWEKLFSCFICFQKHTAGHCLAVKQESLWALLKIHRQLHCCIQGCCCQIQCLHHYCSYLYCGLQRWVVIPYCSRCVE